MDLFSATQAIPYGTTFLLLVCFGECVESMLQCEWASPPALGLFRPVGNRGVVYRVEDFAGLRHAVYSESGS